MTENNQPLEVVLVGVRAADRSRFLEILHDCCRDVPVVVLTSDGRSEPAPHDRLSTRELEVMRHLVTGKRAKMIAYELGISEKTVSTHRARLMKKIGVADSRALLMYALRAGLTHWTDQPA